ncbi:MAG: asparaginase [Chitinophagaceae bacterium]|nr:asparaginase [Chitinophagaceae bacterium]
MRFKKDPFLVNRSPFGIEVLVIYTGGTMGMGMTLTGKDEVLLPRDFSRLSEAAPELLRLNTNITLIAAEKPLDSSNVKPSDWIDLAVLIGENYDRYDGFVILHGTDTTAYTASGLSFLLEGLDKPVVFTGAQLPLESVRTDARENLITAIMIAAEQHNGAACAPEVSIYFDGHLYRANRSRKTHSSYFDAFVSYNYPLLAEAGIRIDYKHANIRKPGKTKFKYYKQLEENISIVRFYPGLKESVFEALTSDQDMKGLILETFGMGNAPTDSWLEPALRKLIARGVVVLNVSQCPGGTVVQGRYQTSKHLKSSGVIGGGDLSTEAALAKMMFVLGNDPFKQDPAKYLQMDLRGELTEEER